MADIQSGQTFLNVLPSMTGYFKRVRAAIKSNPVKHEIDVEVDQRRLAKAKADLNRATKSASDARRREAAATGDVVKAEKELQSLRSKGVTDAGRLAAAEDKVAKAKRNSRSAADALNAAELKRSTAATRVARIETRLDSRRAEADSESLIQRLTSSFESGGRTAGSRFVGGMSATMRSQSRGREEGRSFAAGFVSAIGSGMRMAVVGFTVANDAARSVIKNIGVAATGIGLAARMLKHFSAGLLVSTSLLKVMTGAGVAKLAGLLKLAAMAAGALARNIGRVTAALLVMAAVAKLVGVLTRIGRALGMVTVGAAVALGAVSALGFVVTSFATGPMVAGLTAIAAAMGTVAAAAAGILGPALGVAKMAFSGLSDGAKAWDKSQKAVDTSASKTASAMKAVENAKKSQTRTAEQGARQIVDAEKRVVKAQRDVKEAQEGVTKARQEAKREAEGYARTLAGLDRSEEGATLALVEARKNLRETKGNRDSDATDLWRAEFGVREAEAALEEIKESNEQQRAEIADAQAKGIEGSDRVVDAKEREVDAQEQLREAQADAAQTQKDVAQANIDAAEAVADAYQGIADAQQSAASDDPFADMIGQRLSPLLQAFKGLREEVTDRFSAAMTDSFTAAGGLVDKLKPKLGLLATTFGNIGSQIVQSISSPAALEGWNRMIDGSTRFFQHLNGEKSGLGSVFSGLISVLGTAAQTFADTGAGINGWLVGIGEKLKNITADDLRDSLERVQQVFANIGSVVGPLFELFRGFGAEAASGLAPGFSAMGQAIQDAIPGLMDMARVLMPALGEALVNLAPIIPGLVDAFTPWSEILAVVAPHLATIIEKMAPLAPLLLIVVGAVKVAGVVITAWNATMFAASVAQGVFIAATKRSTASISGNTIALTAHRIALMLGTAASWAFSTALGALTSPITLVIVAIAALVGALIWFFTKTELGKKIWEKVWTGITRALSTAWDFIKDVFAKIGEIFGNVISFIRDNWKLILPIVMGPLGLIIVLVTTFWDQIKTIFKVAIAIVMTAAVLLWEMLKGVFTLIGNIAIWVWETYLRPGFELIKMGLQALGAFFGWVWSALIKPAWDGLAAGIKWVWENVIRPAWDGLKAGLQAVGDFFGWVWNTLIKPVWDALGAGIAWVWENVIRPAWDGLKIALQVVGDFFGWVWNTLIKPVWDKLGDGIKWVWENVIQKAFDGIKIGLGYVRTAFDEAVKFIEKVWDGVRKAVAAPIKFVIDSVYNNGIREAWNKVAGLVGLGQLDEYKPDWLGGYASGTSVLPGYSPGVDNMRFVSTDGRAAIDLSGGEGIARPEVVRAIGRGSFDAMNSAASRGGVPAVQSYLGGFAGGGVVDSISGLVREHFPMMSITSTFRNTNDHHGSGLAVDFSNGTDSTPEMRGAAQWFHDNYGPQLLELIHSPFDGNIKNGQDVGDGFGFYGAGTMGQHRNHVHVAAASPLGDSDGPDGNWLSRTFGAATRAIGRGLRWTVEKLFDAVVDPIGNAIPEFGGSTIGQFPKKAFGTLKDKAKEFLLGKADQAETTGAVALGAYGGNAEAYVSEIVRAAKDRSLGKEGATIGVATAIVESALRMYANAGVPDSLSYPHEAVGSDHDSVGLFQQRQAGWGTLTERMNPYGSAALFFNAMTRKFPNWRDMDPGAVAQGVQVSAFPDRYGQRMGEARGWVDRVFDNGGLAYGKGLLAKDVIKPERVLSPAETAAWEALVPHLISAESAMAAQANLDAAGQYAAEIDWGGVGTQIGSSLLAEWGDDLLGIAGISGQFEGLKLVDDTGRSRSDEVDGRNEASFDGTPTPGAQSPADTPAATPQPESLVDWVRRWFSPASVYDEGGIASGKGYLLKDIIHPERVLSPRQTEAFEQLVPMLDRMQQSTAAPADVMPASALSSLEYAPVGVGGDTVNVYGKADRETMNEVGIWSNQRQRSRRYDGGQR
ncbi:hypothetical protein [Prescottella equi]|uniref:hypothetical protein n=1 Tax=Rhodococcus hoagii TaxID=43767 RepID=UPI0007CD8457|nr:hypothetical protein [Prescottella equi]